MTVTDIVFLPDDDLIKQYGFLALASQLALSCASLCPFYASSRLQILTTELDLLCSVRILFLHVPEARHDCKILSIWPPKLIYGLACMKSGFCLQNLVCIWICPCAILTKDWLTFLACPIILTLIIFHINHLISLRTLRIGLTNKKIFKFPTKACLPIMIHRHNLYI